MTKREELIGVIIGLARSTDCDSDPTNLTWKIIAEALLCARFFPKDDKKLQDMIETVHEEKKRLLPGCSVCASPCGRHEDFDMDLLKEERDGVVAVKYLILSAMEELAFYANELMEKDIYSEEINRMLAKGMFVIGEQWETNDLLPVLLNIGNDILACKEELEA